MAVHPVTGSAIAPPPYSLLAPHLINPLVVIFVRRPLPAGNLVKG